jgi:hypothetical protein
VAATANNTDRAGPVHLSGPRSIRGLCRLLLAALQGPIGEYPSLTPYLGVIQSSSALVLMWVWLQFSSPDIFISLFPLGKRSVLRSLRGDMYQ